MCTAEEYAARESLWFDFDMTLKRTLPRIDIKTIECKRKKKLPSWLTECLEHDVVALREDRGDTVIVMGLETFLELMK